MQTYTVIYSIGTASDLQDLRIAVQALTANQAQRMVEAQFQNVWVKRVLTN